MTSESDMPKVRITISLTKDIVDWLDDRVQDRTFKDRSHAVEKIVYDRMKQKG